MNSKYFLAMLVGVGASFGATIGVGIPTCSTNTLQYYVTNFNGFGNACSIGSLTYSKFNFAEFKVTPASSLTGNITDSSIQVVPDVAANTFSLLPTLIADNPATLFADDVFNRVFTGSERYYLEYNIDPPPIIAGDELTLDPPTGPVVASKWGCLDSDFGPGSAQSVLQAAGGTAGYNSSTFTCNLVGGGTKDPYFLQATTATGDLTKTITFPTPATFINVRFVLDFTPGTVSGLEAIDGNHPTTIPEPSTHLIMAAGLIALGTYSRNRSKRNIR